MVVVALVVVVAVVVVVVAVAVAAAAVVVIVEGSLEVKLPTIWTDEKQRWKGSERRGE